MVCESYLVQSEGCLLCRCRNSVQTRRLRDTGDKWKKEANICLKISANDRGHSSCTYNNNNYYYYYDAMALVAFIDSKWTENGAQVRTGGGNGCRSAVVSIQGPPAPISIWHNRWQICVFQFIQLKVVWFWLAAQEQDIHSAVYFWINKTKQMYYAKLFHLPSMWAEVIQ